MITNWKGLPRNGKVDTIGTYRFHELKLQAVSGHANIIGPGIISSGTRSFLTVTETLAGTLVGLRWLDTVFQDQYLPSLSINYVAINKVFFIKSTQCLVKPNQINCT